MHKRDVYVAARTVIAMPGRTDVSVACEAERDLLLSGSCNLTGGSAAVVETFGTGLDDEALQAAWHCGVATPDRGGGRVSVTVSAACLGAD